MRWLPFAGWLVILFGVSSIPDLSVGNERTPGLDKIFHLGAYAVLGVSLGFGSRLTHKRRALWIGMAVGLLVGTLDELYQSTVPGRELDALDAAADTLGVMLGAFVWSAWTQTRQKTMLS